MKAESERKVENLKKNRDSYFCYANIDGYIDFETDLNNVNYVMEGNKVLQIIPTDRGNLYVDIYINSQNIAGIVEGMKVEYENSSFVEGSNTKNLIGNINSISQNAEVSDNAGNSYYICKADINDDNTIKTDMKCQVHIVVGRESVLKHLLKKINVID